MFFLLVVLSIFYGKGVALWYAPNSNWAVCTGGTLLHPRAGLIREGAVGEGRVEESPWKWGHIWVRLGGPRWVKRVFAPRPGPPFGYVGSDTSLPHDRSIEKTACAGFRLQPIGDRV